MKLTKEQELMLGKSFMIAFARKLYREGQIDVSTLNRLIMKIEKLKKINSEEK